MLRHGWMTVSEGQPKTFNNHLVLNGVSDSAKLGHITRSSFDIQPSPISIVSVLGYARG